jgi:hypothetical protein
VTIRTYFPFALVLALVAPLAGCGEDAVEKETETSVPAAAPVAAAPVTPAETPESVVADLYEQHTHDRGPFFQTEHRDRVDHFFVKDLADLLWTDAVESNGEVGALEFDPLYNAQDTDIKNFKISPAVIEANKAHVPVTFDNFGSKTEIVYSLENEGGSWKISDMQWDKEGTLRELLRPADAASTT